MEEFHAFVRNIQPFIYGGLGAAALVQWRKRGGEAAGWLAATFGVLAAVVVVARLLPVHSDDTTVIWIRKVIIAILVLFPYFLYRFHTTFIKPVRWIHVTAFLLTAAAIVWTLLVPDIPEQGEPRSTAFQGLVLLIVVQWVFLSARVAQRLWTAGKGQPTVARRRMRTLSLGALGLALAIVVAGTARPTPEVTVAQIVADLLGLVSGPLFLLGFAPPGLVRLAWRRPEEVALRDAQLGLMSAVESVEVARVLLPHVARLVGGRGALLVDTKGNVIGTHGLERAEAEEIADVLIEAGEAGAGQREAAEKAEDAEEPMISVPLEHGWLAVKASRYTPFFGPEETEILQTLAVLCNLALGRVDLFRQLASSNAELEQFAYVASHDLQEPLRTVASYAELLRERYRGQIDERTDRYVDYMVEGCSRMEDLIGDLLAFSRVGTRAREMHLIDADRALDEALDNLAGALRESPANITRHDLPVVEVDHSQLAQVFQNLVGNSLKFRTDDPLEVEIGATRSDNEWVFWVSDNGIGIDPKYADRIFAVFQRLHTMAEYPGTGIGLALCKKIIERHGGRIWLDPESPKGATFRFALPATREDAR